MRLKLLTAVLLCSASYGAYAQNIVCPLRPIGDVSNACASTEFVNQNASPTGGISALTGDVTASGPGSAVATIAAGVVTNTKLANMPADSVKCNNTGSPTTPADCTNPVILGITIDPTGATLNKAISTLQSATGTATTDCNSSPGFSFPCLNAFQITSDNVALASNVNTALDGWQFLHEYGGASLTGVRQTVDIVSNFTAASGNPTNTSSNYNALNTVMLVSAGDNGTGTTFATGHGSFFALGLNAFAAPAATNIFNLVGEEIDVELEGSAVERYGLNLVSFPSASTSVVGRGAQFDAALLINAANTGPGATGWGNGIIFGAINGLAQPIISTGCLICTDITGGTYTVGNGINFSNISFNNNAFASPGFNIDGFGDVSSTNYATAGHLTTLGTSAPTITACGTSTTVVGIPAPSIISGTDLAGELFTGAGATSCTLTFHTQFPAGAHCIFQPEGGASFVSPSNFNRSPATFVTIPAGAETGYSYICLGS